LQASLTTWGSRCDDALKDLEEQIAEVKRKAVEREKMRRKKERAIETVLAASEEKSGGKRLGDEDLMDIDEGVGSGRQTRGSKRGGFGLGSMGRRLG
jgi:COP9 signalosome complex subunit 7